MNKLILATLAAAALTATGVSASTVTKAPRLESNTSMTLATANTLELPKLVCSIYDDAETVANYYIMLSDDPNASYNKKTGTASIGTGYLLCLDLYNLSTSPAELPAGLYAPEGIDAGFGPFTYGTEYTYLDYYENGVGVGTVPITTESIFVERDDNGIYDINVTVHQGDKSVDLHFRGRIPMENLHEKASVYPQIKHDIEVDMKGGIAFYQGVTDYSYNGVTYINLYTGKFDANGAMLDDGFNLAMMVAHKRVIRKKDFKVFPGDYTSAHSLARDTWYPCREVNYSFSGTIITTQFGSFIREKNSNAADKYTYGYLATGTFHIEEAGDGKYKGYLDAVTDLGYTVKVNFEGEIALDTENAEMGSAPLSELTDDVDLDFSSIDYGHVYHRGLMGGCRDFTVDLGSPSGKDHFPDNSNVADFPGADILRLEFLSPVKHVQLQPGVYTVVPRRWNSNELAAGGKYEPMSLNQHRYTEGGELDGTRYAHFEKGRYAVYDLWGPVFEGYVNVETTDFINYNMDIHLVDDAGFEIRGTWNGPLKYEYNVDELIAGVQQVEGDADLQLVVEGSNLLVLNAGNATVNVYNTTGALVTSGIASETIDVAHLPKGVYILTVNNQTIKVAL